MLKLDFDASTLAVCAVRFSFPKLVRVNVSDHRRHPRLEFDGRAWCEHQNLTLYLPISNVSAGGLFIQTGAPLSMGQRLKVSFGTLDDDEVVAKVEIVWTGKGRRGAGVGCRFTGFVSGEEAYNRMIARLEG